MTSGLLEILSAGREAARIGVNFFAIRARQTPCARLLDFETAHF
jgi:hypothetical protein